MNKTRRTPPDTVCWSAFLRIFSSSAQAVLSIGAHTDRRSRFGSRNARCAGHMAGKAPLKERRVKLMRRTTVWGAIVGVVLVLVAGFGSTAFGQTASANRATTQGTSPSHINHSEFTGNGKIDNKYFPLKPGTTFVYQGKSEGNAERDLMTVTDSTKRIEGVKCVVVNDRVF